MNLLWAVVLGLTFAVCFFTGVSCLAVKGFFEKLWRKMWTPIGIGLMLAFGFVNICAVTQIDLTTQVKGILPTANGGTGIAFFTAAGPTAARTFTFPDANSTVLTSNAAVTVAQGGTGAATWTVHGLLVGNGGSTLNATAAGSAGQVLTSNGASADPTFQPATGGGTWAQETPTGTINGTNTSFTLANTPISAASVDLFMNGIQQQQGAGDDYTISGSTITYLSAPLTGAKLVAIYQH